MVLRSAGVRLESGDEGHPELLRPAPRDHPWPVADLEHQHRAHITALGQQSLWSSHISDLAEASTTSKHFQSGRKACLDTELVFPRRPSLLRWSNRMAQK